MNERKLAVALRYEPGEVPKVTAKGEGHMAEAILEAARSAGVPIEDDPLLATALATVELDQEIPEALYRAVAEVLGFVLRLSARKTSPSLPKDE